MKKNATPPTAAAAPTPAYPKLVSTLISQVDITLTPDERAFYATSITDVEALRIGVRHESATVLDDCIQIGTLALPAIVAGKVGSYGPLRARYLLELTQALADRGTTLDESRITAAGKSAVKTTSLRSTRGLRRTALRALRILAGKRPEDQERVKRAGKGDERPDERSRVLEALATELEEMTAKVPARVAKDAGATPELIASLRQSAEVVLASRSASQGARGTVGAIYDEMNLLDGKILHELRLLVGAMKDARERDKTVPLVRSLLLRKPSRPKAKPSGEAAPAGEARASG
jgi:hypothetical protein